MVLGKTSPVNIEDEMRSSYLDYAMSVIVSRALPDVRDGLKPVQRRILFAMNDMGINHSSSYKKSARIVGEVLGKYHPHGDTSVYEAMVRLAQDFSMRYLLIEGQGNFGSVDNDPPAAMRYTEARLAEMAEEMLVDIDRDTVDFVPNFDDSLKEPVVLPSRFPHLLVNGSSGIAVGMATNIPPHNFKEVCQAIVYLIEHPEAAVEELTQIIKGPDFPTAGIIVGRDGIESAYATGRGRIVVRAKTHIIDDAATARRQIVVTELPYQVNKAALVERIAGLVADKRIGGISELRDESDRQGMHIVLELKRDAQPLQVLNGLYKHTAMQSAFFVNMLALVDGGPRVISLKGALQYYLEFRRQVVTRRSQYELKEAKARAHILEGLKIALEQIDKVVATIRRAETAEQARHNLMTDFGLSQVQAQAILDMQLRRLASLERNKILDEYAEVLKRIAYLAEVLADPKRVLQLIKEDIQELEAKYGDSRRTEISGQGEVEFHEEDLIPHQEVVVTLSHRGFIKRVPVQFYTLQHRGGKGIVGMQTREEDALKLLTVADTHDNLLFFTNSGKAFYLKCYEIAAGSSRTARGMAVINLFPIAESERVTGMVAVPDFVLDTYLLLATRQGEVKKTALGHFASMRSSGLIAMDVARGDELVAVCLATDQDDVMLVTQKGLSIRFVVSSLRASSRTSGGACGIRLAPDDRVIGIEVVRPDDYLLVITTNGFGKLTQVSRYPRQHRAGRGVRAFTITPRKGELVAAKKVSLSQQIMIVSADGIIIRIPVRGSDSKKRITIQGRMAQGVRLMKPDEGDQVAAVACFD